MDYSNTLIFGKDTTERVVCVERHDNYSVVFIENVFGEVYVAEIPSQHWLLSNQYYGQGWRQLKGRLHYQYARFFASREEMLHEKRQLRKRNRDVYAIHNERESLLITKGITYYKGMTPTDVSVLSFDLETTGLKHDGQSRVLLISNTFRKSGQIVRKLFGYDEYRGQQHMLESWCAWVRQMDPSILCGHNIMSFDLPYLKWVAEENGADLRLGRDESAVEWNTYESKFRYDGSRDLHYIGAHIYGREIVDTLFLSVKADIGRKYQSYALKSIIKQEGVEKQDRVLYDASRIRYNYTDKVEWAKIRTYCEHDADDSLALFDLFVPPFFYMAQSVPKSFQGLVESATGSQLNAVMVRAYLQDGRSVPQASEPIKYEGAISFGKPGVYSNCIKWDVASLYPSIMLQYKVGNPTKDPLGHFGKIVAHFTKERLENKRLAKETGETKYKHLEQSQKIAINSLYGFLGAPGLLFNSPEAAAFITEKGREILTKSIQWAENKGLFVANGDTDSIMVCAKDGAILNSPTLLEELNKIYPSSIHWEDDGEFPKVIVFKAKNYVLYDGEKLKFKGSSLKSPTLEPALLELIDRIVKMLIAGETHYQIIYEEYVKEAADIRDIARWVSRKTISERTMESERANESKIRDAIEGTEYTEGDRIYTYFTSDGSLALAERFNGDYSKVRYLEKLFKASQRFDPVITKGTFVNYKLKRNQKTLEVLLQLR